jgi:hypothetical protein
MEILYSCVCGARNLIEVENPPTSGKPAFFYCHDCGKPSWDHCTRCGFNVPVGSNHQFCKGCGACTKDTFQPGVETLDFLNDVLKPFFFAPILMVPAYFAVYVYFSKEIETFTRKIQPLTQAWVQASSGYMLYAFFWLLGCGLMYTLIKNIIGPLWGMRMGKTPMPLVLREVVRRGPVPILQADLDAGIHQGRWLWQHLRRKVTPARRRWLRSAYVKFVAWRES